MSEAEAAETLATSPLELAPGSMILTAQVELGPKLKRLSIANRAAVFDVVRRNARAYGHLQTALRHAEKTSADHWRHGCRLSQEATEAKIRAEKYRDAFAAEAKSCVELVKALDAETVKRQRAERHESWAAVWALGTFIAGCLVGVVGAAVAFMPT